MPPSSRQSNGCHRSSNVRYGDCRYDVRNESFHRLGHRRTCPSSSSCPYRRPASSLQWHRQWRRYRRGRLGDPAIRRPQRRVRLCQTRAHHPRRGRREEVERWDLGFHSRERGSLRLAGADRESDCLVVYRVSARRVVAASSHDLVMDSRLEGRRDGHPRSLVGVMERRSVAAAMELRKEMVHRNCLLVVDIDFVVLEDKEIALADRVKGLLQKMAAGEQEEHLSCILHDPDSFHLHRSSRLMPFC